MQVGIRIKPTGISYCLAVGGLNAKKEVEFRNQSQNQLAQFFGIIYLQQWISILNEIGGAELAKGVGAGQEYR